MFYKKGLESLIKPKEIGIGRKDIAIGGEMGRRGGKEGQCIVHAAGGSENVKYRGNTVTDARNAVSTIVVMHTNETPKD